MNRAFFVLSALSGVAAVALVLVAVRSFRSPAAPTTGAARAEQLGAVGLLALGVLVFAVGAFSTGGDISGPWLLPPAGLLAVTGILAWRQPGLSGRLLLWSAAVVVPLTLVVALAVSASNRGRPGRAPLSNVLGAVTFAVLLYAAPAAVTGWLLHLAAKRGPGRRTAW